MNIEENKIIDDIMTLPYAPKLLNKLQIKLQEEQKRREDFYNSITEQEKVEFINGEIVIHSPVKKEHNDVAIQLSRLITIYVDKYKLGYVGYEKIMTALTRNDYEPDICFFKTDKAKAFKQGQSLFPAPDLVVEVLSPKTASRDRGIKFEDYRAHGVEEYWIIDPKKKFLELYRLDADGNYDLILKSESGFAESQSIQGFKIAIEAIFNADKNLEEVSRLLST